MGLYIRDPDKRVIHEFDTDDLVEALTCEAAIEAPVDSVIVRKSAGADGSFVLAIVARKTQTTITEGSRARAVPHWMLDRSELELIESSVVETSPSLTTIGGR